MCVIRRAQRTANIASVSPRTVREVQASSIIGALAFHPRRKSFWVTHSREASSMATLLLIVLVLLLIGAVPAWPYNTGWGYYPSGGIGLLLLIVLLLAI